MNNPILEGEHLEILNKYERYQKSSPDEFKSLYQIAIEVTKDLLKHRFELSEKEIQEKQRIK